MQSEDDLIERLAVNFAPGGGMDGVLVGVGDDCAVLDSAARGFYDLLKTDAVVAGVHFSNDDDPVLVGRKALCRAVSDIAAMGGMPLAAVVTVALPKEADFSVVEEWYRGLTSAARDYGVQLVGGETTSTLQGDALLSVAMTGRVEQERCVLRSGAWVGDVIVVTGRLGGSLASGRHLDFVPRLAEACWLTEVGARRPSAMMDLSDGLAKDLPRMAKASGVGYRVDFEKLPLHGGCDIQAGVGDGEDYELLMTFAAERLPDEAEWHEKFGDLPLTVIGEITEKVETPLAGGWDHLR